MATIPIVAISTCEVTRLVCCTRTWLSVSRYTSLQWHGVRVLRCLLLLLSLLLWSLLLLPLKKLSKQSVVSDLSLILISVSLEGVII
jgi:hypothetical protein